MVEIPSWTRCLRLTMTYVPVWLLIGAATTLVTKSLVADPPIARVGACRSRELDHWFHHSVTRRDRSA